MDEFWAALTSAEAVKTLIVIVVSFVGWRLVRRAGGPAIERITRDDGSFRAAERRQRAETIWVLVRRVILVAILVVVALTIALIWGVPITPFVAVGSVVGVAIGFGAQGLVSDVIAGFFIVAEDQFHIGDVIRIAGVSGSVEDVRLRVTVLRDLDGVVHYIPNGKIEVASNYTQEFSRLVVDVGVAYAADVDGALATLRQELEAFAADPEWADKIIEPPELLGVDRLGDSAVILRSVLTTRPDDRWTVKREALRRIKKRFSTDGIEIPFPQVTIHRGPEAPENAI